MFVLPAERASNVVDRADRLHGLAVTAFVAHARTYVVINGFLVGVWFLTGGYFWPIWVILGWGLGLVLHCLATFSRVSRPGR
jgi:hypothetical protein